MLDVAVAQLRYSLSLLFGMRFSVRSLERMLAALRETQREFGVVGKEGSEILDGPVLDEESRRSIQLQRFRQQARRAMSQTAYYQDLFARLKLDSAKWRYEDITRLPCTPKEAVRDNPDAFVSRQARPFLRATTTGTTGKPTSICFSEHELRVYFALSAMPTFFTRDLQETDIVQISTSSRGTLGNLCLAGACAHIGAMVYLAGVIDPAQALAQLCEKRYIAGKKKQTSVLYTYPSYLGELVEYGLAQNYRPADFGLERISVGGEIVTQGLKKRCERLFGSIRFMEGSGMTEIWPVGGRLCEAGHLHFEVSQGLIEVQQLENTSPAQEGEAGTLVVTPFPPYRETTLLLRYDTQDVVRVLPSALACSLRHLPATSNILGKRSFAVQHEQGWTFPREVLEALEAVEEIALPARCGFWAVPGGVALEVQCRENTPELQQKIQDSLQTWGVPVQALYLVERGQPLQHPLPLRCDLREQHFTDFSLSLVQSGKSHSWESESAEDGRPLRSSLHTAAGGAPLK
jgi:phenylacetate-CoA ligase